MFGRTDDDSARWLDALNKVRKIGTTLLDQQLWCWGQDIRRAEGNALLAYGFTKHRPPEGKHGTTAYEWRSSGRSRVVLWGFGFFYGDGDRGGLFLQRYKFAPKQTAAVDFSLPVWKPEQLPELTQPCDVEAVACTDALLPLPSAFDSHRFDRFRSPSFGFQKKQATRELQGFTVATV